MINQYPAWKYAMVVAILIIGILYALPNIYGKRPSLVISPRAENIEITKIFKKEVRAILNANNFPFSGFEHKDKRLIISFEKSEEGFKAQRNAFTVLDEKYIEKFVVAQTLLPNTPNWLQSINGKPLNLGLDLQGGVHALMDVKLEVAIEKSIKRYRKEFKVDLKKYRYKVIRIIPNGLKIWFKQGKESERKKVASVIRRKYPAFTLTNSVGDGYLYLSAVLGEIELEKERDAAIEKNILTMRRRINELGVNEPIVTRQGKSRIVVQLPGIQDPAKLWLVLDKEATLEAHGVSDEIFDPSAGQSSAPLNTEIYYDKNKKPVLLKKSIIWHGENVKDARAGFSNTPGNSSPAVHIKLDSEGGQSNSKYTAAHINKGMAIVFRDSRPAYVTKNGKSVKVNKKYVEVINVATIQGQLYKQFEINGLDSTNEAQILAILLRSGSLAAPVVPAEVRTVGPSLGAENVNQGMNSVVIGFVVVLLFMLFYYRFFGFVANVALIFNLVLLIAILSMLQATLTLPGIAGIVLTVGMAVDANVLIFERIREELRLGNSPQASINSGYEKAFATIADANITTFIAALVLLGIGSGPVKGFATTLSLGILTSMFTAIMGTRAIINWYYGGRKVEKMSI